MAGNLVTILYNLADTFFVGQTGDEFQVAAVTLTSPVFMALTALGILFGIGGGSFISRQLGERKPENACKASALCFWGSLGLGVLFLAAGIAAPAAARYAARRLGRNLRVHARLSADHPARLARNPAFQHARTAHPRGGRAKCTMLGMMLGTVVNIALDPLFIFTLRMGVAARRWPRCCPICCRSPTMSAISSEKARACLFRPACSPPMATYAKAFSSSAYRRSSTTY